MILNFFELQGIMFYDFIEFGTTIKRLVLNGENQKSFFDY